MEGMVMCGIRMLNFDRLFSAKSKRIYELKEV